MGGLDVCQLVLTVVDHARGGQDFHLSVQTSIPHVALKDDSFEYLLHAYLEEFQSIISHLTVDPFEVLAYTLLVNGEIFQEELGDELGDLL
jgi:hypothetical protein